MAGQAQMDPSSSGLRLIEADYRNQPNLKGISVSRGISG